MCGRQVRQVKHRGDGMARIQAFDYLGERMGGHDLCWAVSADDEQAGNVAGKQLLEELDGDWIRPL